MKGFLSIFLILAFTITMNAQDKKYPEQAPMRPAMSEYWTPQPPVVTPGNHGVNAIPAPSDAIVLFDGTDL